MRKLFTLLSFALVVGSALALTSCDIIEEKMNKFTVDGANYKLTSAEGLNYGKDDDFKGNNTDITLFGKGDSYVYFEICAAGYTLLHNGTYQFSQEAPYAIGTFTPDSRWSDGTSGGYFKTGTITVHKFSDFQYEFEFSCVDENGQKVTGYYNGYINFTSPVGD